MTFKHAIIILLTIALSLLLLYRLKIPPVYGWVDTAFTKISPLIQITQSFVATPGVAPVLGAAITLGSLAIKSALDNRKLQQTNQQKTEENVQLASDAQNVQASLINEITQRNGKISTQDTQIKELTSKLANYENQDAYIQQLEESLQAAVTEKNEAYRLLNSILTKKQELIE